MAGEARTFEESIARYSVAAGPPLETSIEKVILVVPPPRTGDPRSAPIRPLELAFEQARKLHAKGAEVRIVAHGATVRSCWPAWVEGTPGFTLTELGVYRRQDPVSGTRELAVEVRRWLDEIFADVVQGIAGGRLFYASAAGRMLQPLFELAPYVSELKRAHPGDKILWLGGDSIGLPWTQSDGGMPRDSLGKWQRTLTRSFRYMFARTLIGQIRNYWRSAPSRRRLRHLRRRHLPTPSTWLALVPDWQRINAHVVQRVARPELARGRSVGILLCTTLLPGERRDHNLFARAGSEIWPGLRSLNAELAALPIDQIVGPESFGALIGLLLRGRGLSRQIRHRLLKHGDILELASFKFPLRRNIRSLARLATTDVLQAISAAHAVQSTIRRHDFSGTEIVFASVGLIETAAPDLLLQKAGAKTIDFKHGAGGESWVGQTESTAAIAAVWSNTDAELCATLGHEIRVLPPSPPRVRQPQTRIRNILIISNYVHQDWAGAAFPLEPFQVELVNAVPAIRACQADRFAFRWRPHPNDDEKLVQFSAFQIGGLSVSRRLPLAEDLAWADLVLASPSSTIIEVLRTELPLFVHVPPAFNSLPDIQAIHPCRRFFYARDVAERVRDLADSIERGDPSAVEPERRAREAFFGDAKHSSTTTNQVAGGDAL